MATKIIKCIVRFAAIVVLITIVQANHSFKASVTNSPGHQVAHNQSSSAQKNTQHVSPNKPTVPISIHNKKKKILSTKDSENKITHLKSSKRLKKNSAAHKRTQHRASKHVKRNSKLDKKQKAKLALKNARHDKKNLSHKLPSQQLKATKSDRKAKRTGNNKPSKSAHGKVVLGKKAKRVNVKPLKHNKNVTKISVAPKKKLRHFDTDSYHPLSGKQKRPHIVPKCSSAKISLTIVDALFQVMDRLNTKHRKVIKDFVANFGVNEFNNEMYEVMLSNRSVAERALTDAGWVSKAVPAGLELGGYGTLKQAASLMFFHRLKLRNDTDFILFGPFDNDMRNMVLRAHVGLGDLHLVGNYERLIINKYPPNLYYVPTYGRVEFLLSKADFLIRGRYRVANGKLRVEQVVSNITAKAAFMNYQDIHGPPTGNADPDPDPSKLVTVDSLEDFLDRVKIDLNDWVKDYFNDYLTYFSKKQINAKYQSYDEQKALIYNDFIDYLLRLLRWLLDLMKLLRIDNKIQTSHLFALPDFTIKTSTKMTLRLTEGTIIGLNTIYRRSVATGPSFADDELMREIEAVVGFSNLKVVYKYAATLNLESPPVEGQLILTANDLTAHMGMTLFAGEPINTVTFDQIQPLKVQTVTVEGPVNRLLASYRHVLENHITSLLTNVLINQVKELSSIFVCTDYEDRAKEPLPQIKKLGLDITYSNDQQNLEQDDSAIYGNDPEAQEPENGDGSNDGEFPEEQDSKDGDVGNDDQVPDAQDSEGGDAGNDDKEPDAQHSEDGDVGNVDRGSDAQDPEDGDIDNDDRGPKAQDPENGDGGNDGEFPEEQDSKDGDVGNDDKRPEAQHSEDGDTGNDDKKPDSQDPEDDNVGNDGNSPEVQDSEDGQYPKKKEDGISGRWTKAQGADNNKDSELAADDHSIPDNRDSPENKLPNPLERKPAESPNNKPQRLKHQGSGFDLSLDAADEQLHNNNKRHKKRRFVGRQVIAKKGGKDSRSVLVVNG